MGLERLWKLQYKSIVKAAFGKTLVVAKFFCALHVTRTYLCTVAVAEGPSMLPTINLTGDILLVDRLSVWFGKVAPGDIVIVRSPGDPQWFLAKRLLGMEANSVTYVVDPTISDRCETIVVPKGHVWVQGDNIYNSADSRDFGPVPYKLIEGRVFLKIWPPKEFGSLAKSGMKDPDL